MSDLRQQLGPLLQGRVAIVGVGNSDYGDDGLGVCLAQQLAAKGLPGVVVAGNTPERFIGPIADERYDTVLFLDAVELGAAPGSVILLNTEEIVARFPQVSTHKISLGMFAELIEANGITKACLLGIQPESLKAGTDLTETIQTTLNVLADWLYELVAAKQGIAAQEMRRAEEAHI